MNSDLNIPGGKYTDFDMEQLTLIIVGDPKVTSGVTKCRESLLREFTSSIIDFHEITPRTSIYDSNVSNETFDELDLEIWVVRSGRSIKRVKGVTKCNELLAWT